MKECPKCESKDIESYDRFSSGCAILILAPIVLVIFTVLGASAGISAFLFVLMLITGIVGLFLTFSGGRKIFTCNICNHRWTRD